MPTRLWRNNTFLVKIISLLLNDCDVYFAVFKEPTAFGLSRGADIRLEGPNTFEWSSAASLRSLSGNCVAFKLLVRTGLGLLQSLVLEIVKLAPKSMLKPKSLGLRDQSFSCLVLRSDSWWQWLKWVASSLGLIIAEPCEWEAMLFSV